MKIYKFKRHKDHAFHRYNLSFFKEVSQYEFSDKSLRKLKAYLKANTKTYQISVDITNRFWFAFFKLKKWRNALDKLGYIKEIANKKTRKLIFDTYNV